MACADNERQVLRRRYDDRSATGQKQFPYTRSSDLTKDAFSKSKAGGWRYDIVGLGMKTLMVFPSIFKGEHISHTEMVEVLTGKEITVRFDSPAALQIDGETVKNVSEYSVKAYDRENGDRRYTDGEKEKESETV